MTQPSTQLVLWRHGQTAWNAQARYQGQTDIPLDEIGTAQVRQSARFLASLHPDMIVSSDLARAAMTAAELARITGQPVVYDKNLRERYGGSWEGLTLQEIRSRYPDEFTQWEPPDGATPDGDTDEVLAERVEPALERVAGQLDDGGLAIVVSHAGAIRLGIGRLLGMTPPQWRTIGPLANGAWSVLEFWRGGWRLLKHNATAAVPGRNR